ncbi:MAG: M48 family metalloprotease [Deltaproteobacteria bacterium]|nr:M48 family metalloprotease [Deltaproteobacteria bacterium]
MADPVDYDDDTDDLYEGDAPTIEMSVPSFDPAELATRAVARPATAGANRQPVDVDPELPTRLVTKPTLPSPQRSLPTQPVARPPDPFDMPSTEVVDVPPLPSTTKVKAPVAPRFQHPPVPVMDLDLPTLPPERTLEVVAPVIEDLPLPSLEIPAPQMAAMIEELLLPSLVIPAPQIAPPIAPAIRPAFEASGPMRAAGGGDENLAQRRRPTQEIRPVHRTAELPPVPERVNVGGGGGFQVVKPILPPTPTAPPLPASWLPPPARPVGPLDPPMPAFGGTPAPGRNSGNLPPTPSGRFGSGAHPASPAVVDDEPPPPPKPKPPSPPLSKFVIQNLAAAGVAILIVLVIALTGGDDGYTSDRFSVDDQKKLANLWKAQGIAVWGGAADVDVNAAVAGIGLKLVAVMADELDERPISFLVVKERDVPQAFGLPDGTIVITIGMMKRLTNEAQLAAILAHTIAHQALGHVDMAIDNSGEFASMTAAANEEAVHALLTAIPAVPVADKRAKPPGTPTVIAMAVSIAESSASALNTPNNEASADTLALHALEAAGYDQRALRSVLVDVLAPVRRQHANWLLQHPDMPTRLDTLKSAADEGGRTGEAEYEALRPKLMPPPPPKPAEDAPPAVFIPGFSTPPPVETTPKPVEVKKRRR